jgi:hypothetical protein
MAMVKAPERYRIKKRIKKKTTQIRKKIEDKEGQDLYQDMKETL